MKYAIVAALVSIAAAAPAADNDWEPVKPKTTTPAVWEPAKATPIKCSTVSTWTATDCGSKKNDWEPCKYETKYTTLYPEYCPTPMPPKPTETWAPVPPAPAKCSTVSSWTESDCSGKKNEWDACKVSTKYTTLYPTVCPTPVAPKVTETWVPVSYTTAKCSSVSTYTTTDCSGKKNDWDVCSVYTKSSTVYPSVCPTPVAYSTTETWAPVVYTTSSKPVAAATTSSWSPVATFKGAADKQAVGIGALAIAAVAALL